MIGLAGEARAPTSTRVLEQPDASPRRPGCAPPRARTGAGQAGSYVDEVDRAVEHRSSPIVTARIAPRWSPAAIGGRSRSSGAP